MIIDYPVILWPLKVLTTEDLVKQEKPAEIKYAVLSNNRIIAKADTVQKLGIEYRAYVLKHIQDKAIRAVSYECPFNELHTKEHIYNVKPLGTKLRDFNSAELFSLNNIEKNLEKKSEGENLEMKVEEES